MNIRAVWNKRLEKWLNRRIPDKRQFQMDMSNIFIFPSKFGIIFCFLCVLLFILGTNYRNNLMLLLSFFLLSLFLVNVLNSYANFARLQVQLGKVVSVFAGNDCPLPLWLGDIESSTIADLNCKGKLHFRLWQKSVQRSIEPELHTNPVNIAVATSRRGYLSLPRITIESYYPLGLFRCWTHLRFNAKILVYPKPLECELIITNSQSGEEESFDLDVIRGNNDFDTLKKYVPGEPLNRVAWKSVAKGRGMMSKQFSDSWDAAIWLELKSYLKDDYEKAISHLTYQVIELSKRQVKFGLNLETVVIEPGSGNLHREECLMKLALIRN